MEVGTAAEGLPERAVGWKGAPGAGWPVATGTPCISRRVSLFIGIAQKQATRCGSPTRLSPDPLTHSSPRPDKREERTGGEDWKKKRATGVHC